MQKIYPKIGTELDNATQINHPTIFGKFVHLNKINL